MSRQSSSARFKDVYERVFSISHCRSCNLLGFFSVSETIGGQQMFVFNLTSLASTERVISAEIHLYKRRKERYNRKSEFELLLHEISPQDVTASGKIVLKPETYGWQWFDITGSTLNCFAKSRAMPHSLGLNFKVVKPYGESILHLKRFMFHHSVPYLIVYSNDSQSVDLDEFEKLSEHVNDDNKKVLQSDIDSKVDIVLPERTKRNRRSLRDNSADIPIYNSRARSLSILTNEIPEDPEDYNRPYPINIKNLQTHPGMLQTRKESRHRLTDPGLIPYPGEYHDRKRLRNRRKKNKKRRRNHLELPKEWEDLQQMAEDDKADNLCSKKKLIVDFNDIGWGEWIISPKSFKAHYCSGLCTFPLTKVSNVKV